MGRLTTLFLLTFALVVAAQAAPSFEKVPDSAMTALKGTRGKPFTAGIVFCNGAYVKPPYRIVRYGTAIFVNDQQLTDQIVPWKSFLATQEGYVAPAAPVKAAPAAEKKGGSVDDLFDDEPAKPAPGEKAAAAAAAAAAVAAGFSPNARSEALLKKVNAARLEIQRKLKDGNICFFGARYGRVVVEPRVASALLDVLPESISDAADGAALAATLRAKGFVFMHRELCDDLIEHRKDYPQIIERRRVLREEASLQKMFRNAQGGGR